MPRGISTSRFFRLCARAPEIRSTRWGLMARARARHGDAQLAAQVARGQRPVAAGHQLLERPFENDFARRARRRPGPDRQCGPPPASRRRRAPPPRWCCPARAALPESGSAARCRGCAGRWKARPARSTRPPAASPRHVASWMRCASPPESVEASRSSVRYSSPTSLRNFSRWRISTRILSAMALSSGLSSQRVEKLLRLGDVHAHHLGQVPAAHAHVERFLAQPRALAFGTQRVARGSGSGTRARAACTSWFPGGRRSGG